jgi:hypothetical protein
MEKKLNKQPSEEIINYIKSLKEEYSKKLNNDPEHLLFNEKSANIINKSKEIIFTTCNKHLKEIEKNTTIMKQLDGSSKKIILPGNEKIVKKAMYEYEYCIKKYDTISLFLKASTRINQTIIKLQTDYCVDDCWNKYNFFNDSVQKNCYDKCFDYSFNYTDKIMRKLLFIIIDKVEKEFFI